MNTWEHATVSAVTTSQSAGIELHTAAGTTLLDTKSADSRSVMTALNTLSAEDGWETVSAIRYEREPDVWTTDYLLRRPTASGEAHVY